jgi:hypothetical protein
LVNRCTGGEDQDHLLWWDGRRAGEDGVGDIDRTPALRRARSEPERIAVDQTWTINYLPEDGRLTGKLNVRDDEVTFEALYDSSFKTIAKSIGLAAGALAASGGHLTYLRDNGEQAEVVFPTSSIERATDAKKGLMKRVVIRLTDGSEHTFEYGLMSVKKLVAAVNEVAAASA